MTTVRQTVVGSSMNVAPRGGNRIVHLTVPRPANRHHGRLAGRYTGCNRHAGIRIEGVHKRFGSGFGGTVGANLSRSLSGSTRNSLRGVRSGCVGGVSSMLRTGGGRVVAMWLTGMYPLNESFTE